MRGILLYGQLAVAIAAVAGCQSPPGSGAVDLSEMIEQQAYPVASEGTIAPDIPFTTQQGRKTTLHRIRRPITILVFTTPDPTACCAVKPELLALVSRLYNHPVTVVQISEPTAECPEGPGCVEVCSEEKPYLLALCDADRVAWRQYGSPELDSLVLIDSRNMLVDMRPMSELDIIETNARRMAARIMIRYRAAPFRIGPRI